MYDDRFTKLKKQCNEFNCAQYKDNQTGNFGAQPGLSAYEGGFLLRWPEGIIDDQWIESGII